MEAAGWGAQRPSAIYLEQRMDVSFPAHSTRPSNEDRVRCGRA